MIELQLSSTARELETKKKRIKFLPYINLWLSSYFLHNLTTQEYCLTHKIQKMYYMYSCHATQNLILFKMCLPHLKEKTFCRTIQRGSFVVRCPRSSNCNLNRSALSDTLTKENGYDQKGKRKMASYDSKKICCRKEKMRIIILMLFALLLTNCTNSSYVKNKKF